MNSTNRKFIAKNRTPSFAQDYEKLRQQAILWAQELSGDNWTDYNHHDPGVTIIEQICYAITELSYQAKTNFEELFLGGDKVNEDVLKADYFLRNFPSQNEMKVPVVDSSERPDYYSIQKTFPSNYELDEAEENTNNEKEAPKGDAIYRQRNFRAYLTLLEALLVDFHLRTQYFSEMMKVPGGRSETENKPSTGAFDPSEKFAKLIKALPGQSELKADGLKKCFSNNAFTITQEIALKEYMLARYGEMYDQAYKEDLKVLWGKVNFTKNWDNTLSELIREYEKYGGGIRFHIFEKLGDTTENRLFTGVGEKLKILFAPHPSLAECEILIKNSETDPTKLAKAQITVKGTGALDDTRKEKIENIIKLEIPFYFVPPTDLLVYVNKKDMDVNIEEE